MTTTLTAGTDATFDEVIGTAWPIGVPFALLFSGDAVTCPRCTTVLDGDALMLDLAGLEVLCCNGCGAVLDRAAL